MISVLTWKRSGTGNVLAELKLNGIHQACCFDQQVERGISLIARVLFFVLCRHWDRGRRGRLTLWHDGGHGDGDVFWKSRSLHAVRAAAGRALRIVVFSLSTVAHKSTVNFIRGH